MTVIQMIQMVFVLVQMTFVQLCVAFSRPGILL